MASPHRFGTLILVDPPRPPEGQFLPSESPEPRNTTEPTDAELIRSLQGGDRVAFEVFYRRHRDWVGTLALRFCGHREDALDVLQETFAYFLKKLPDLELCCEVRTFLYPAVKHIALRKRMLSRRQAPLDSTADFPARDDPGARTEGRESLDQILTGLTDDQREVVCLRFADGLELAEIGEALGIPLGTVKSRLHLAMEKLRARRRKDGPDSLNL